MSTKIKSLSEAAGVGCPKNTGEMDKKTSCKECRHYSRCMGNIMGVLGVVV